MKKTILSLLLLLMAASTSAQSKYDVNGDGSVTIADVTLLVNVLLGKEPQDIDEHKYIVSKSTQKSKYDVSGDGQVTIGDVTLMVNVVLGKESMDVELHGYVDLGLPSGTLWATCNIGATSPEDYGLYFAWGETTGYIGNTSGGHNFDWTSYKYCKGTTYTLTKYCTDSQYGNNGFTDNLTELLPEDDAAYVNWGSQWRIPSLDQQTELRKECKWHFKRRNDVGGYEVVGPNGNSIFLPFPGYYNLEWLRGVGVYGHYWSRTLFSDNTYGASRLDIDTGNIGSSVYLRCRGHSIRPVRNK